MSYYLYKGLKKPLVFFGLKGKYILYAVITIGGGVLLTMVISSIIGLFGTLLGVVLTAGGVYLVFRIQDKKGLYNKTKNNNQVFVFPKKMKKLKR
ncbi:DUF4133 domain-containing protein [Vaginella massiliensis]|uniref:DUF4133 domain-containing protein n=1 Tax=Vaginella massiliensis TaxID=1816680 RepID=UPI0008391AD7|nr:DUF4133 domain-containing protein [Vaginella massiliensis]